jgi:hypothetical protein
LIIAVEPDRAIAEQFHVMIKANGRACHRERTLLSELQ